MRKESRRVVRIWVQTIVPPAITMTLYFIIFGSLVGARIGAMEGVPYTTFIAPGLIMMAVITNSFANVVSSFFSSKLMLHLEEMLVAPLAYSTIVVGFVIGGIVRGLLVAALVTVVALFFTDLHIAHPLITVSTILLTATVFSLAGLFNAIFAKTFDDISIIPTFVLTPLTYLGECSSRSRCCPRFGRRWRSPIRSSTWSTRFATACSARRTSDRRRLLDHAGARAPLLFGAVLVMLHRGTGVRV